MIHERDNGDRHNESPLPRHAVETIREENGTFRVEMINTLPLSGKHNGIIVSSPGLGAHWADPEIRNMRDALNAIDYETIDWFEAQWGNMVAPVGSDGALENMRALRSYDLVMREAKKRAGKKSEEIGKKILIRGNGWSRGSAIAAAGVAEDPSLTDTLTLICPGFMDDTGWTLAQRFIKERVKDLRGNLREKGVLHIRDVMPFFRHSLQNIHRTIHRGGATAGWSPIAEMFAASLAGIPIGVIQGKYDETFPPDIVRNNIEKGYVELYDTLVSDGATTIYGRELEQLMPSFYKYPTGHGLGTADEAAHRIDFVNQELEQKLAA